MSQSPPPHALCFLTAPHIVSWTNYSNELVSLSFLDHNQEPTSKKKANGNKTGNGWQVEPVFHFFWGMAWRLSSRIKAGAFAGYLGYNSFSSSRRLMRLMQRRNDGINLLLPSMFTLNWKLSVLLFTGGKERVLVMSVTRPWASKWAETLFFTTYNLETSIGKRRRVLVSHIWRNFVFLLVSWRWKSPPPVSSHFTCFFFHARKPWKFRFIPLTIHRVYSTPFFLQRLYFVPYFFFLPA